MIISYNQLVNFIAIKYARFDFIIAYSYIKCQQCIWGFFQKNKRNTEEEWRIDNFRKDLKGDTYRLRGDHT